MATTGLSFSAQIDNWVKATKERTEAVFHKAAEKVGEAVQDGTPIVTGTLVHSFQASGSTMPTIRAGYRASPGASYGRDIGPISLVIRGIPLGGTVYMGFTAEYAPFVEYGTSKMGPRRMVGMAAQRWPQIVQEAVREAKASVRGSSR